MIRYLSLEFYKIRRRGVFLTALLLCGVEGAWTAYSVQSYFEENGANLIWNNLFTNLAMLHGLFLPLAIAVLSSRICDMEHKGDRPGSCSAPLRNPWASCILPNSSARSFS